MIILDATNRSLEFKLSGAPATNQIPFVSFYVDHTASAYTPISQNGVSNSGTAVTVVTAPGASTQRSLKYLNIRNRDTAAVTVTVQYNDNTTIREMLVVTLSVDDTLEYLDTDGWSVINTSGQKKSIASLSAGTAVIGHIIADSGSTTVVTGSVTVVQGTATNLKVDASGVAVPVTDNSGSLTVDQATGTNLHVVVDSGSISATGTVTANAGTNLNTSALALEAGGNLASLAAEDFATETTLATRLTESDFDSKAGSLTETAPATDIASSGLNGRLQRIAQRITSLIALLPSALVSGRLDVNLGAAPASVTVGTVTSLTQFNGQAISLNTGVRDAGTLRVSVATNDVVPASQSGTWTVQPGNTPNTTPWLVGHGKTLKTVSGSLTADTDVIAAVSTKRIKVVAYSMISSGTNANTVIFKSNGTGGTELWRLLMQSSANIAAGANLAIAAPSFLFATVAGEKLTMDVNQTDTIHYSITYFDDDTA